jgi:hypothetical protein
MKILWWVTGFVFLVFITALTDDYDALKITRKNNCTFTQKPTIKNLDENTKEITFAISDFCDVSIAIESEDGNILRHLASGLLGDNAPLPFQPKSLQQKLIWDGKNDAGEYVNNNCVVRVSIGLKALFEKTLYWSPYKRNNSAFGDKGQTIVPQEDGVYVYDGGQGESLKLFSHEGKYIRTISPISKTKVEAAKDLNWYSFPQDNKKFPLKHGMDQYTYLTHGFVDYKNEWPTNKVDSSASSIVIKDSKIYLINKSFNIVTKEGDLPAGSLNSKIKLSVVVPGVDEKGGDISPCSSAISNDGRYLYLSGYVWSNYLVNKNFYCNGGLNGVARIDLSKGSIVEPFIGSLENNKNKGAGDGEFDVVSCVFIDKENRIFVGDFNNDRIQVYDENKKLLKSIKVSRPVNICINPKNNEIFVFSFNIPNGSENKLVPAQLFQFKSFEDPKLLNTYAIPDVQIPVTTNSIGCHGAIDFFGEEPVVWFSSVYAANYRPMDMKKSNISLYKMKESKLIEMLDFGTEAEAKTAQVRPAHHSRQRLYFNPKNKNLYVGEHLQPSPEHSKSFNELIEINVSNEKCSLVPLPFDAEDMAFDINGLAYFRTHDFLARFELVGGKFREIPFDYGVEQNKIRSNTSIASSGSVVSGLPFLGSGGVMLQLGGMAVSPKGNIAVIAESPFVRNDTKAIEKFALKKPVLPLMFKGRSAGWEVYIWDKYGKLISSDGLPGLGMATGISMDVDDSLYIMMASAKNFNGKPYFNPISCTLVKTIPGKTKILSTKAVLPLGKETPDRAPDLSAGVYLGESWVQDAAWTYGGVGIDGKRAHCACVATSRPTLDLFKRSFVPEVDRYGVVVIDTNGNTIMRIGQIGNVDDGKPLVVGNGPPNTVSIGGDEVALMNPKFLATESDRRLFIADIGNSRIVSVLLTYETEEKLPVKIEK